MAIKEINFHKYCPQCNHLKDLTGDACYICMSKRKSEESDKPIKFIDKASQDKPTLI